MGDERTYENVVALRAVTMRMVRPPTVIAFTNFGTSLKCRDYQYQRDKNRVVYDISSKPPATIEWNKLLIFCLIISGNLILCFEKNKLFHPTQRWCAIDTKKERETYNIRFNGKRTEEDCFKETCCFDLITRHKTIQITNPSTYTEPAKYQNTDPNRVYNIAVILPFYPRPDSAKGNMQTIPPNNWVQIPKMQWNFIWDARWLERNLKASNWKPMYIWMTEMTCSPRLPFNMKPFRM